MSSLPTKPAKLSGFRELSKDDAIAMAQAANANPDFLKNTEKAVLQERLIDLDIDMSSLLSSSKTAAPTGTATTSTAFERLPTGVRNAAAAAGTSAANAVKSFWGSSGGRRKGRKHTRKTARKSRKHTRKSRKGRKATRRGRRN